VIRPDEHNSDHKNYAWSQAFCDALEEKDPQKLNDKLVAAEAAIFNRLQALAQSDGSNSEIVALREASNALLTLKTHVLKFPDWRQG
jgi:hypothetical protein